MGKVNLDVILLYNNVRLNEVIMTAVKIFNEFYYREYIAYMEPEYYQVQRGLLEGTDTQDINGNYWQNYICKLVAESENQFSLISENTRLNNNIKAVAMREMSELKKLYSLDWHRIGEIFKDSGTSVCCMSTKVDSNNDETNREKIKLALEAESDRESVDLLQEYYNEWGCGIQDKQPNHLWR